MGSFLIADDSPRKTQMLRTFLTHAGWTGEVLTAATTEEAIDLIDSHSIEYAFVDYFIPSRNGPTVIAHLKSLPPPARIALVSSTDSRNNTDEALRAGAETFVCTSWESDRVERTLLALLEEWMRA